MNGNTKINAKIVLSMVGSFLGIVVVLLAFGDRIFSVGGSSAVQAQQVKVNTGEISNIKTEIVRVEKEDDEKHQESVEAVTEININVAKIQGDIKLIQQAEKDRKTFEELQWEQQDATNGRVEGKVDEILTKLENM